ALRVLDADDQHVLREPAFLARLPRSEPQRVTLLAEQRVAAVAGAHAPDELFLGEVQDQSPLRRQIAERVHAGDEVVVASHRLDQAVVFLLGAVAPYDIGGSGHAGSAFDPLLSHAGRAHGRTPGSMKIRPPDVSIVRGGWGRVKQLLAGE